LPRTWACMSLSVFLSGFLFISLPYPFLPSPVFYFFFAFSVSFVCFFPLLFFSGSYGERIGALHIVSPSAEHAKKIESQVKIVIRPMYDDDGEEGRIRKRKVIQGKFPTARV
jgi:hypothetical protein